MENTNGDASPSAGLESADSSGAADDRASVQEHGNALEYVATCIERAQDRLRYGRRQEAEEAICFLDGAQRVLTLARAAREG